jgi:hypothetical protein
VPLLEPLRPPNGNCGSAPAVCEFTWKMQASISHEERAGTRHGQAALAPRVSGDAELHWLDVVAERVEQGLQGISMHYYTLGNTWQDKLPATGFPEKDWYAVLRDALKSDQLLIDAEKMMEKHDPSGRVGLYMDEWGTWYSAEPGTNPAFLNQQSTIRDAVVAGATFNIFHRHAKRLKMANIAQHINVLQALILTEGDKMLLTPTYHVFAICTRCITTRRFWRSMSPRTTRLSVVSPFPRSALPLHATLRGVCT